MSAPTEPTCSHGVPFVDGATHVDCPETAAYYRTAQAIDDFATCTEPSDNSPVTLTDIVSGEVNDDVATLGELLRDNAHDPEVSALLVDWAGRGFTGDLVIPQFGGTGVRIRIGEPA
jgi:hypothetical protein